MIRPVNVREIDLPLWKELDVILDREGLDFTDWCRRMATEYIKNHKEGNSTFKLEKWTLDPDFLALPSLGETLFIKYLDGLSEDSLNILDVNVCKRYNEVKGALRRRSNFQ